MRLDQPSTWEPSGIQLVVPADAKDFSRPKEPFWQSTADINSADDRSVKLVQQFMKTSPLGISYPGEVDGYMNDALGASLHKLEEAAKAQLGMDVSLISGSEPLLSGINQVVQRLEAKPSNPVEAFQKLFGMQPTGEITPELVGKIQAIEKKIADRIQDTSAIGMIYDPASKSLKTSPGDVAQALAMISGIDKK